MAKSYLGPGGAIHLVASIESHDVVLLTCVSGQFKSKIYYLMCNVATTDLAVYNSILGQCHYSTAGWDN